MYYLHGKEDNLLKTFIGFLHSLEAKIKFDAQQNAKEWFSLDENKQNINFQKIIRESNKCENGTLKVKIL
jgi:hypothetical protein